MTVVDVVPWIGFNLFVLVLLAVDLGLAHRKSREVRPREALAWSAGWVLLALLFNVLLYFWRGGEVALDFLTGYVIEKTLSVDNLFVFLVLFAYFRVPAASQHKVLFWGILGALLLRGAFIALGSAMLHRFHAAVYLLGAILVGSAIKLAFSRESGPRPERNLVLRLMKKIVPVTDDDGGGRFWVRREGKVHATPLFLALVSVEATDVVFAVDSIPAIFSVTEDSFVVYTSNVFALLGLRSLYFVLAGALHRFRFLKPALAVILGFVGIKMLLSGLYPIPTGVALGVVAGVLLVAMLASAVWPVPRDAPQR